jgi:hypothetical protein
VPPQMMPFPLRGEKVAEGRSRMRGFFRPLVGPPTLSHIVYRRVGAGR